MYELGKYYEANGYDELARSYFKEAAVKGHAEANYELGVMYSKQGVIFSNKISN